MAVALEIYEALRSVGVEDTKAKSTAEKFDQTLEGRLQQEIKALATREEYGALRERIAAIHDQMATREDLAGVRAELARLEARLIKWNVATIIAVAGLTLAIVKLVG